MIRREGGTRWSDIMFLPVCPVSCLSHGRNRVSDELRIGARVITWKRSAIFGKGSASRFIHYLISSYVNLDKAPMTGTDYQTLRLRLTFRPAGRRASIPARLFET